MSMTDRAEYELRRAGFFDSDSDYDGAIGPAVMEIYRTFSAQGHSGYSAGLVAHLFKALADGETLTPITNDPGEWADISDSGGPGGPPMWQNKRAYGLFSLDGGKTYYHLDKRDEVLTAADPK